MTRDRKQQTWRELGLTVVEWADSAFLLGVGKLGTEVYKTVLKAAALSEAPLDWQHPFQQTYRSESEVLWWKDPRTGKKSYLPQVVLLGLKSAQRESEIRMELLNANFQTVVNVGAGLDFYRRSADGGLRKLFFNGENARLVEWSPEKMLLRFQGCNYFDYLQTNMALDADRSPDLPLRKALAGDGRLEPLDESELANSVGINGLIFTCDGYMIFQRRGENVLVRPGELCSAFSGTVDRIDVQHAVEAGGKLTDLDAPREMVEELGLRRSEISSLLFLGITRELTRGGTPEMFYAADVSVPAEEVLERIPPAPEGKVLAAKLGHFARSRVKDRHAGALCDEFAGILDGLHAQGEGEVSIPLLTNLLLWLQVACPDQVGTGSISGTLDAKVD